MDNRQASGAAKAATSAMSGTGLMVGLRCWIAILAEGYDAGVRGAILSSLATDSKWHLSPLQLGAMGSSPVETRW
jgi:AAHS family benzoate transporter-like MFS transporter